jgi:hypothetical protein
MTPESAAVFRQELRVVADPSGRTRERGARVVLVVAALLAAWAIAALVTGGVRLQLAGVVASSRNPLRPAIVAVLLAAAAWRLDSRSTAATASRLLRLLSGVRPLIVPLAAAGLLMLGVAFGGRAAIAADVSGYLSQSILWTRGHLRIEQPFVSVTPWPNADWTFTPLGYRPAENHTLVPTYAPGLPLLMAGARFVSACAPYYIVPICGALLVLLSARLGHRLFGRTTAVAGAVLVAASPVVLIWTLSPMSDVPVAMFWIAALVASDRGTLPGAAAAGALSGAAIVIRPNLAPLALFPVLLTAMRGGTPRAVIVRAVAFAAAVAPFAIFVGTVHNALYGSPLTSGYGDASSIYSTRHLGANLARYPLWWWQAHGVVGWLFLMAIFRPRTADTRRRVIVLVSFAAAVALSYMFYLPFEHWLFLRFMLPALPIVLLLSADAVVWMSSRLGPVAAAWLVIVVAALTMMTGLHRARWDGFFATAAADQRYADAALYIDSIAPPAAVVLAMQHSGSVRFYSGRLTLRYDVLDPAWLDRAIATLASLGFSTFALLEKEEEDIFRTRFKGQRAIAFLDSGPLAIRRVPGGELRLFAMKAGPVHMPADIPRTSRFDCLDVSPQFARPVQMPASPERAEDRASRRALTVLQSGDDMSDRDGGR